MIKRFLIFAYWNYEAQGGWNDLCGMSESLEAAQSDFDASEHATSKDFAHIVDLETGGVVSGWNSTSREWESL